MNTWIDNQAYYNHHTAPVDGLFGARSPLLQSWVEHVEQCQDLGLPCGYHVGDSTVHKVIDHIKTLATADTVIMAHFTLFESSNKQFNRLLDTRFMMCGSDMFMMGTLDSIPVVMVAQTHYAHAYKKIECFEQNFKWVAAWEPDTSACFWRSKQIGVRV
jgi:hypothetical protein